MRYVFISLALTLMLSGVFPVNVLAKKGDTQKNRDCEEHYEKIYPALQRGELEKSLEIVNRVKNCSALDREKIEYAYTVEADVLVDLERDEEALLLTQYILENNIIQDRKEYISYVMGDAAQAAYRLGNDALSLHYYHLAVLESEEVDPLHRVINQEGLAILQVRTQDAAGAIETIDQALLDLDDVPGQVATRYRVSFHQMAASALLFTCDDGIQDIKNWDPTTCPSWSEALEHHRLGATFAEELTGAERREAERGRLNTDFIIARYRQNFGRALDLLDRTARLAEANNDAWGSFQAQYRRALILSDQGNHGQALELTTKIGRNLPSGQKSPYLPYLLSTQVRIAADAKNRRVAQQAMQELAALDGDVPDNVYKQASAAYASVFGSSTGDASIPFWVLLSIAVGLSVVLQFISTAARRNPNGLNLFRGRIPFLPALAGPASREAHLLSSASVDMPSQGTLLRHAPSTGDADGSVSDSSTDTGKGAGRTADSPSSYEDASSEASTGDGVAWTDADADWMRSIGIDLNELPVVEPPSPTSPTPTTLGGLLKTSLTQDPSVPCYDTHGRKTGTVSLTERIINHASDDRFIAIRMPDRIVIAYRYSRPQNLIIRQRPDGSMETVKLDQPVTAIPIAIIDMPS